MFVLCNTHSFYHMKLQFRSTKLGIHIYEESCTSENHESSSGLDGCTETLSTPSSSGADPEGSVYVGPVIAGLLYGRPIHVCCLQRFSHYPPRL